MFCCFKQNRDSAAIEKADNRSLLERLVTDYYTPFIMKKYEVNLKELQYLPLKLLVLIQR